MPSPQASKCLRVAPLGNWASEMGEPVWFLVAHRTKEPVSTRAATGRVGDAVVMTTLIAQRCLSAAYEWAASRPRHGGGDVSLWFSPAVCRSRT